MARISGWGHTRFGKLADEGVESLLASAVQQALAHSGIPAEDIDEVYVSQFNAGMDDQGFPSSLPILADTGLRFKPSTRVENACASGSAAVTLGARAVDHGGARHVLVVGVEKMTAASAEKVREALVSASYVKEEGGANASFAGLFGQIASSYFERYGDKSEALARIAAKNHANGVLNPLAHMQKDFGFDFCNTVSDRNPLLAGPLRRTDCSMVSDGAAAIVLSAAGTRLQQGADIRIRSMAHINDLLPMRSRDMTRLEGCQQAWKLALQRAAIGIWDLDFVETHDCFTIAELIQYEAMGLTEPGEGQRALDDGIVARDGKLPVNLSGGLKAKGHPIGATGVSMHVMAARQLSGDAAGAPRANARLGGVFNMGGAGVANYCTILERHS